MRVVKIDPASYDGSMRTPLTSIQYSSPLDHRKQQDKLFLESSFWLRPCGNRRRLGDPSRSHSRCRVSPFHKEATQKTHPLRRLTSTTLNPPSSSLSAIDSN